MNLRILTVFVALLFICFVVSIQGDDSPCWGLGGRCQYTSEPCGQYRAGYCAGPTNRQCCVIGEDLRCWARGGTCKNNWNYCSGSYVRGLCGGGLSRQCCV